MNDLSQQIEKRSIAGIEGVIVVTNLPENSVNTLKAELQKKVQDKGLKIRILDVVQGNANALIHTLDRLSTLIAQRVSEELSKMVENVAKNQTKEIIQKIPEQSEAEPKELKEEG